MNNEEIFDLCLKEAIRIGRKYMTYPPESKDEPTKQEWDLALILFSKVVPHARIEE
jgi:hypothetical protein